MRLSVSCTAANGAAYIAIHDIKRGVVAIMAYPTIAEVSEIV